MKRISETLVKLKTSVQKRSESAYAKATHAAAKDEGGKSTIKPKLKKKRKMLFASICLLVAAGAIILITLPGGVLTASTGNSSISLSETTELAYSRIQSIVSATGTVESAAKKNVYTSMNYTIAEVLVEVGDIVAEGEMLLELDKASIEEQIKEKEISLSNAQASGSQSVNTAKDNYNRYKEGIENGTNSSLISANSSVQTAYDNYLNAINAREDYLESLHNGTTTAQAANTYSNAQATYSNALSAYNAAKTDYDALNNQQVTQAQINQAKADLEAAKVAQRDAATEADRQKAIYDKALIDHANGVAGVDAAAVQAAAMAYNIAADTLSLASTEVSRKETALAVIDSTTTSYQQTLATLKAAMDTAQKALQSAASSLATAEDAYDDALRDGYDGIDTYDKNIESAYKSYQTALESRTAAEVAADNQLESYQNSLATARIGANGDLGEYQLEQMYIDLENATITAPMSGTVTAVYAVEGATSSGILFVIEDTDHLVVESTVKGYDIGNVKAGMPVVIKCDTTGDVEHAGQIKKIAPTSAKNSQGDTDTSGDIVFPVEVEVSTQNTGLRIGLNVRLQYVLEEQAEVLCVPYSAVYSNEQGKGVLVLKEQPNGGYVLHEVVVIKGMESDADIVVSAEELTPGLRVLNSPDNYLTLLGQQISVSTQSSKNSSGANGMPGGFPF